MEKDHSGLGEVTRVGAPGFVGLVESALLAKAWPQVREFIVAAIAASAQHELHIDDVERHLFHTGEYILVCMQDGQGKICGGAILTQSQRPDGSPYLACVAVGGSHLDRWDEALAEAFKVVARSIGATEIILVGRPGWRKALAKFGVRERAVILSYEVA